MRKLSVYALLMLLPLVPHPASAATKAVTADSKIMSVTVYPDQALVTRTATVELGKGDYRVVFKGLPGELRPDSIRVSGMGTSGTTIGSVDTKAVHVEQSPDSEMGRLTAELDKLTADDRRLEDEIMVADFELAFYKSIQLRNAEVWSKEATFGGTDTRGWAAAGKFVRDGMLESAGRKRELEAGRASLKKKIDALSMRITDVKGASWNRTYTVGVEVRSGSAGKLDLELGYVVSNATWIPSYEASADSDKGKLRLKYQASVTQNTSEDWRGVRLTLSTARPAVGAEPPALEPWYVREYSPRKFRQDVSLFNSNWSAGVSGGTYADAPSNDEAIADTAESAAEMEGANVVFVPDGLQDVPADGTYHKVPLKTLEFKADYEYVAVPKLSPYAYLKGFATNSSKYPLLSGDVSVFSGNDYVGNSGLRYTSIGGKFELALGIDEGIRVKRERTSMYEDTKGIVRKRERVNLRYEINVESFKKKSQKLTVIDHRPVSTYESITVNVAGITPKPTKTEDDGILEWSMTLKPGDKKKIFEEYQVLFPKGMNLSGI